MSTKSLITILTVTALLLFSYFCHSPYLLGTKLYTHDSNDVMGTFNIVFSSLFGGELPLWNPQQNGGEPLWPTMEVIPAFDPIAILVWIAAYFLKLSAPLAYQWTCYFWLSIFALGGMFCSRKLCSNWWVNASVLVVLFGSGIGFAIPAESTGFLYPFRYLPWVYYFFICLWEKPDWKRALWFGLVLGISGSGIFTIYPVLSFLPFFSVLIFFGKRFRVLLKYLSLSAIISLVWYFPTFVSVVEMLKLIPVSRLYRPGQIFVVGESGILSGLFDFNGRLPTWHGHSYIGILAFGIAIYAVIRILRNKSRSQLLSGAWLLSFGVCILFNSSLLKDYLVRNQTLVGLRTWGFMLTPTVLCLAQLFAAGMTELLSNRSSLRRLIVILFATSLFSVALRFWGLPISPSYILQSSVNLILFTLLGVYSAVYFNKKNFKSWMAPLVFCLCIFDLIQFSYYRRTFGIQNEVSLSRPIPMVKAEKAVLPRNRIWEFDQEKVAPYQARGARLWNQFVAKQALLSEAKTASQGFRLPRYHRLLEAGLTTDILKKILGVTAPIIYFPRVLKYADDFTGTLNALKSLKGVAAMEGLAIIEGSEPTGSGTCLKRERPRWELENYNSNQTQIRVNLSCPELLVYSDGYEPGWKATIDGNPAPILIANGVNKAIRIPAGGHLIQFRYEPLLYILGFWFRLMFLGAVVVILLFETRRRLRGIRI